jgi:long-chain acyl-CoA synthetase
MSGTLNNLFHEATTRFPERTAAMFNAGLKTGTADWQRLTYSEMGRRAEAIGEGLLALGLQRGDRVCMLANSRYEWTLTDFAILGTGCIVVPIYQTNSPAECEHILVDSGARAVIVEDAAQLAKIEEIRHNLPALEHVIVIDPDGTSGTTTLADIEDSGRTKSEGAWRTAGSAIEPGDLATFIYTSGTTGPPKGCQLTHNNYFEMTSMIAELAGVFSKEDRIVLFLPLAHTFARLIQFAGLHLGAEICYSTVPTLMDDLQEIKPTVLPSVPRVFEKAHTRIQGLFAEATGPKAKLISWAMRVGRLRGRYLEAGRRVPPVLALQYATATKLVFHKIQERFGGELKLCISGGAPLGREVQEFFLAAGILILEGYGLTESTTAVTLNRPDAFRLGSVGPALPRTEIRIANDGEIMLRGPQIFQGYRGNDEATREILDPEGWLHSGDIGVLDKGFLRITDRKKDIIVTAGGKNIAPQNIEGALKATQYVSQALVYGDKRPYLTALITLDAQEMESWASQHGSSSDLRTLIQREDVQKLVAEAVDKANSEVGRVEHVKRYRILPVDFTQETGELTPTLKLKRKLVCERYNRYIEEMYEADAPDSAPVIDPEIERLQEPVPA